jgi:Protein of unknown function (DUF1176)
MRSFVYLTLVLSALFTPHAVGAQSPTEPVLGKLVTKKDWAFGCDNNRRCEAVALLPDNASDEYSTLKLSRGAGDDDFNIQITGLSGKGDRYRLFIDGRLADTGPIDPNSGIANISNADALKLARFMARGKELSLRDAAGAVLGRISLAGSTAAMRHIDVEQGRQGSKSALASIGRKQQAPIAQPLSIVPVQRIAPTADLPDTVSLVRLAETSPCAKKRPEVSQDSAYSLGMIDGQAVSLVLLNCGSSAYTVSVAAMIGFQQADKSWKFDPARFDAKAGLTNDMTMPLLVNANWDQPSQTLSSSSPSRAIGDCGTNSKYVWDGKSFRLILAEQMDECRGARDWITLWRAAVR